VPASSAQAIDQRGRFREIFCAVHQNNRQRFDLDSACDDLLIRLSGEPPPTGKAVFLGQPRLPLQVLLVPGIFNDCIRIEPLRHGLKHLQALGYGVAKIAVSGRSSSIYNARLIKNHLMTPEAGTPVKRILIGYSKGTTDILETLIRYPEIRPRISAVVALTGTVNGSPLADGLDRDPLTKMAVGLATILCAKGDGGAIQSLRRSERLTWLTRHQLPDSIAYFSVGAFTQRTNMSSILRPSYDKLAFLDPRNDGQVLFSDMIIPGSTLLGYANADHWAVAIPFGRDMPTFAKMVGIDHNHYPRPILLEAIVRFVEETLLLRESETK
jgi:hypothetical protein